jgi:hypothetical protein
MFVAPPSKNLPLWNTATTERPAAKVSGSTCVSWLLPAFR